MVFALAREGAELRLGITATRRVGGAVVRNRCRRRVRELARRHLDALAPRGADIVVNVRLGLAQAPWHELEEDFLRCLTAAGRRLSPLAS